MGRSFSSISSSSSLAIPHGGGKGRESNGYDNIASTASVRWCRGREFFTAYASARRYGSGATRPEMIELDRITIETVEDMRVAGVQTSSSSSSSSTSSNHHTNSSSSLGAPPTTTIAATLIPREASASSSGSRDTEVETTSTAVWPHEGTPTDPLRSTTNESVSMHSADECLSHSSSSSSSHTYWSVHRVDGFSRGRIMNYIRRMGVTVSNPFHIATSTIQTPQPVHVGSRRGVSNANDPSSTETADAMLSIVLYTATLHLPLPPPHGSYMAEGVGESRKDAELLAAMHAERVCDALGVPLFRLPSMQQNYAENIRRNEGRHAPLPGDPLKPEGTPVPPPLRMVSAAVEAAIQQTQQQQQHHVVWGQEGGKTMGVVEGSSSLGRPVQHETHTNATTAGTPDGRTAMTRSGVADAGEAKKEKEEWTFFSASSSLFSPRVKEAEVVQEHLSSSLSSVLPSRAENGVPKGKLGEGREGRGSTPSPVGHSVLISPAVDPHQHPSLSPLPENRKNAKEDKAPKKVESRKEALRRVATFVFPSSSSTMEKKEEEGRRSEKKKQQSGASLSSSPFLKEEEEGGGETQNGIPIIL